MQTSSGRDCDADAGGGKETRPVRTPPLSRRRVKSCREGLGGVEMCSKNRKNKSLEIGEFYADRWRGDLQIHSLTCSFESTTSRTSGG